MKNDKYTRFERLSGTRLDKVLKSIKVLGNCANRSVYQYTEPEVDSIFRSIEEMAHKERAKFTFESSVVMRGESNPKTWRELTAGLCLHGEANSSFSKVLRGGKHRIRFRIPDSPVWITCYSSHFEDPEKRDYGIFISYTGVWDDRDGTHKTRKSEELMIKAIKSSIKSQRNILRKEFSKEDRDKLSMVENNNYGVAGITKKASDFASDERAVEWLSETLDKFAEVFVPLIRKAKIV